MVEEEPPTRVAQVGGAGARSGIRSAGPGLYPHHLSLWGPQAAPSVHLSLFPRAPLSCWALPLCPLSPPPCLHAVLTCSPARRQAATPWQTVPSGSTGLRSRLGPSAGGSHTTAAGEGGGQAPAAPSHPQEREPGVGWGEGGEGWTRLEGNSSSKGLGTPGWGLIEGKRAAGWRLTISIQTLVVRASSRSFWGCRTEG